MSTYSYFASTAFGLYHCANWHFDSSTPTWEHTGQTMGINEFALDLNDPDEFQACRSGDSIYVRRPTHYGHNNWVEVFSVADAQAQWGGNLIEGFKWIEINSASGKEGHMYAQAHTGLDAGGESIYLLKSEDYGASWGRTLIIGGTIRATGGVWAGRVTGNVMYASYNGHGLVSSCKVRYSTNEGGTWAQKQVLNTSLWVTRVMIDPSNEATSYMGHGVNGPNLHKSTTVSGGMIPVKDDAGLCIFYGHGGGWISAQDGNYVRTIRDSVLYYSDTGGGSGTWSENNVTDTGYGAFFERAMWGHDSKPHWVGVASRTSVSSPFINYHLLKSTQDDGGTWYDKAGAHASTAGTGGGDSIPYNCGGVADNGLYLTIPSGRVFTSVVQMGSLPTGGTVYADGVQMGPLPTGGTVYAHGVEQENPRP